MKKPRRRPWLMAVVFAAWLAAPTSIAQAAIPQGLPASASCAALAAVDPSATNGPAWGQTLLRGHSAPGGWFGVDVCANAVNSASPGGANVSCNRVPADLERKGCAPGHATFDGFGLSFQCVELVARFAAWAFGDAPSDWHGDAPDLWLSGNHPADMTAQTNGGGGAPVPGDILVWGHVDARGTAWIARPTGSHDGHVAVVESVGPGSLTFVEQNALSGARNVARETIPLSRRDGRWAAGAYGGPRVLYGWLHSARNTGRWTGTEGMRGSLPATGSPAPSWNASPTLTATPAPVNLPSLSAGVLLTSSGTLVALDWSGGALAQPERGAVTAAPGAYPAVSNVDLGAPNGTTLTLGAAPVVLSSPGGDDVFALGRDGRLYTAHIASHSTQASWTSLGAPSGAVFTGGVSAASIPGAVVVGAVATDGSLWWRAGPVGSLGDWGSIGHPNGVRLVGPPVMAGQPGSGLPLAVALGRDGRLYEVEWSLPAGRTGDAAGNWGAWAPVALPAAAGPFVAPLYATSEMPGTNDRIGEWADTALDLVARSNAGGVWLLHLGGDLGWHAFQIGADGQADRLLAVVAPSSAAGDSVHWLHVYAAQRGLVSQAKVALAATSTAPTPSWTAFDAASSLRLGQLPPTPLVVGPRASVLVSANGGALTIVGVPAALAVLVGAS